MHLHDARIEGARGAIRSQNQFEPRGQVQIVAAQRDGVKIGGRRFGKALHKLVGRPGGDQRGGAGGVQQAVRVEVVGVGVAGAFAAEHADAAAGADSLAGGFDDLLVHAQRGGRHRLKVQVGIVAAGRERLAQAALQQPLGDAEFLKKVTFVTGRWGSSRYAHRISQFTPAPAPVSAPWPPFLS